MRRRAAPGTGPALPASAFPSVGTADKIGAMTANQSFKDHFSGHAADYANARPVYPPALAAALAQLAPGRALALDCGCGSGQLSTLLAAHFERVVATDASAAQIKNAVPHPKVEYRVAPAEASGLPDHCADLVVAAQAAHWFDLPAFFREVDRVARPGGLAALVGYGRMRIEGEIDVAMTRFHDVTVGPHWPPERALVEGGYAAIDFPYPPIKGPTLEMTASWSLGQVMAYLATWSAVKAYEKATDSTPLPAIERELASLWGDPATRRTVRWPLFMRLGIVGRR